MKLLRVPEVPKDCPVRAPHLAELDAFAVYSLNFLRSSRSLHSRTIALQRRSCRCRRSRQGQHPRVPCSEGWKARWLGAAPWCGRCEHEIECSVFRLTSVARGSRL